jgi:hypothetical protein
MRGSPAAFLVCAAWALAALVGAQPLDKPGTASRSFTATVASADAFKLVLRADNGKLVTFPVDDPWTIPAGLVPGTRVTVRYDAADDGYRLVAVKIASGPIEPGSTTEPPDLSPAPPSAPAGLRKQPGTSPALPQAEPEPTPEPTPQATAQPEQSPTATEEAAAAVGPRAPERSGLGPARAGTAGAVARVRPERAGSPPAGARELVTLATLLVVSSALLWVAFAQR